MSALHEQSIVAGGSGAEVAAGGLRSRSLGSCHQLWLGEVSQFGWLKNCLYVGGVEKGKLGHLSPRLACR